MMNLTPIEFLISILLCLLVTKIYIYLNRKWYERINKKIKAEYGILPNEKVIK